MTVINGLPAHVLCVHFIVVLAPLTALLEIVCARWRAALSAQRSDEVGAPRERTAASGGRATWF